jgi:hypothetical protein
VNDDGGGAFVGVATIFYCTNFSGVTERVRFVTRSHDNALLSNETALVPHLATVNAFTHANALAAGLPLPTGQVFGGTTAIAATSTNFVAAP